MPAHSVSFTAAGSSDLAAATLDPFHSAQHLLCQGKPLSTDQFAELDELLRRVSHRQFLELTDDPAHQPQLRVYRALSRRIGMRAITLALAGLSAIAGSFALFLAR
ncbi:hypothetical protein WG901_20340 [Novosphingobium sp. PS1R-30]|uniref:DUF3040 domain-containing protein n=1 Tax=Novosphingobium anseongense TaxID=3133436 RepID=A0ABU8S174_9SPHN